MANGQYDSAAAAVIRLIAKFGKNVTLYVALAPADPAQPWRGNTTGSERAVVAPGVLLGIDESEQPTDAARRGDMKCLVAGSGLNEDLSTFDRLVDANNIGWSIVDVQRTAPDGTVLLWDIRLKR